uniref:hypothetical protein n=1 Tax=Cupriavidus taiwanensis TaxID=164546 RepID=UPI0011C05F1B|nr:hypothetical protein [Cupriavidus taiwanensis]
MASMDVVSRADSQGDSETLVALGKTAWVQLKDDAPRSRALSRGRGAKARERREQSQNKRRRWWLAVGQALLVGKRESKTDHAYYAWLKANGFDDMARSARKNAIWFALNAGNLGELPDGMASPGTIRQWANKQAALSSVALGGKPANESVSCASPCVSDAPLLIEVQGTLGQQKSGGNADLQRVADLLLEAAMSMQRSVDLFREIAGVIQQSPPDGEE